MSYEVLESRKTYEGKIVTITVDKLRMPDGSEAYRETVIRKKNAAATGITQNVTDCLRSPTAKNMLANSEFLLMLSQAPTDQQELVNLLHISGEQLGHISNAASGHGLIKVGGALVPFVNQFPRDTELYRLMTTRPGESL